MISNMQEKAAKKISAIQVELKKKGVYVLFISALDEIAWTLNLRGNDVHLQSGHSKLPVNYTG